MFGIAAKSNSESTSVGSILRARIRRAGTKKQINQIKTTMPRLIQKANERTKGVALTVKDVRKKDKSTIKLIADS